jgi:D-citramalate synthase
VIKGELLRKIYYIISDVLDSQSYQERIVVESYILSHAKDCINYFVFKIDGEIIEEHAQGDGQFDAFMNALAKIYKSKI